MTAVNQKMKECMRSSMRELDGADEMKLVPIQGMSPHFMSMSDKQPTNGLVYMFGVDIDDKHLHVYLKQSEH